MYLVEATYKVWKQVCVVNYESYANIGASIIVFACMYVLAIRMLKLVIHRIAILLNFSSSSLPSPVVAQEMPFHMFHLRKVIYVNFVP